MINYNMIKKNVAQLNVRKHTETNLIAKYVTQSTPITNKLIISPVQTDEQTQISDVWMLCYI